jgi:ATP-dependent RNA helicase SUPV3L1/SUV3
MLRTLGVRIGAFSLYMPALLKPDARALAQAFAAREADAWRPPAEEVSTLPTAQPPARVLAAYGLRAVRGLAVPVEQLERLDELLRAAPRASGGATLSDQAREELGWSPDAARRILRGLGFVTVKGSEPAAWRRRAEPEARPQPAKSQPHSPFAALAALKPAAAPTRRRRRKPRARRAGQVQ